MTFRRERAERADALVEELIEQVSVLSRMLFGHSADKTSGGGQMNQQGKPVMVAIAATVTAAPMVG